MPSRPTPADTFDWTASTCPTASTRRRSIVSCRFGLQGQIQSTPFRAFRVVVVVGLEHSRQLSSHEPGRPQRRGFRVKRAASETARLHAAVACRSSVDSANTRPSRRRTRTETTRSRTSGRWFAATTSRAPSLMPLTSATPRTAPKVSKRPRSAVNRQRKTIFRKAVAEAGPGWV